MDPQPKEQSSTPANAQPLSQATATVHCGPLTGEGPDPGTLPENAPLTNKNIIRYERRAGQSMQLSNAAAANEVMVIDESTPTPPMPRRQPYIPVGQRRPQGDTDVLYIGPE